MVQVKTFKMPKYETTADKEAKKARGQITEIYHQFIKTHPGMTDEQEILVLRERFRSPTPDAFRNALDFLLKNIF